MKETFSSLLRAEQRRFRQTFDKIFHIFAESSADGDSLAIVQQDIIRPGLNSMPKIDDKTAVTSAESPRQLPLKFVKLQGVNLLSRCRHHRRPSSAFFRI